MFNFLSMADNYEERKVDRFEIKDTLVVDTCAVTDIDDYDFETAVSHKSYNEKEWIIVEQYKTKEEAQKGHDRWVKKMTKEELPKTIEDVSTCELAQIVYGTFGDDRTKTKDD